MRKGNIIPRYSNILAKDFPERITKYIEEIEELKRLDQISYFCGMDYCSKAIYNFQFFYSTLDHSESVARMVWHFTHDYPATIAALLHDIGSPAFRHAIDYMNGDASIQESTEGYTEEIIRKSTKLEQFLTEDGINIEDVIDYKKYPIADNERPRLSADRLDSVFMGSVVWLSGMKDNELKKLSLKQIARMYQSLKIVRNEDNIPEMAFDDLKIARQFLVEANANAKELQSNEDKLCMALLGEITRLMLNDKPFHEEILYSLTDAEAIEQIKSIKDERLTNLWYMFQNMNKSWIKKTDSISPESAFAIDNKKLKVKLRVIDPLVIIEGNPQRLLSYDDESFNKTKELMLQIEKETNENKIVYVDRPKRLIR